MGVSRKAFRQALVYARVYTKVEALHLRAFLANGLCKLFDIHHETEQKVPFLPTEEEMYMGKRVDELPEDERKLSRIPSVK